MPRKPERAVLPLLLAPAGTHPPVASLRRLLLPLCLAGAAVAQQTIDFQTVDFQTGDGSRVLLFPIGGPPLIHWAIATPCGPQVDPPSTPGMAAAVALASLRGTWTTGSLDADRERRALLELDAAETDLAVAPRLDGKAPPDLVSAVDGLRRQAAALGDPLAYRRVMMALPTQDLRVTFAGDTALLELTTTQFAVPAVARLLRERREEPALRGVRAELQQLQERATAAWDNAPLAPLYAEVLALAFAGHPLARSGDRPATASFQRALATATFARSQHPSRSVHVLIGNFDTTAVRAALEATFATTALPTPDALQPPLARALPAMRRSQVPGARYPAAVLAFAIPPSADPLAAATAAGWFADGPGSWLHSELVRRGRKNVEVAVRAPWPAGAGPGLLVVEVRDPAGGGPKIADEVLELCTAKVKKEPRPGDLPAAFGTVLRDFEQATRRPGDQAARFAARLLQTPGLTSAALPPHNLAMPELTALLQQILGGNPIVIEWRDA